MRILRIFLQLVIVLLGGLALAALIFTNSGVPTILVFGGFVAFLLVLTFCLKEETESRIVPRYRGSTTPMSVALVLLGMFGIFSGYSYLMGDEPLFEESARCRAICGLTMLIVELFGESIGRLFAGFLWLIIGAFLCFIGKRPVMSS